MKSTRKFYIAISGIVLVVIFWIWWVSTNPVNDQALVQFLSIAEVIEKEHDERTRLGGLVVAGSITLDEKNYLSCRFDLQEGNVFLPIHYTGVRPDLFKDEAEVIVEGNYMNGVFEANVLQTKCASRYEGDLRNADSYNLDDISL